MCVRAQQSAGGGVASAQTCADLLKCLCPTPAGIHLHRLGRGKCVLCLDGREKISFPIYLRIAAAYLLAEKEAARRPLN